MYNVLDQKRSRYFIFYIEKELKILNKEMFKLIKINKTNRIITSIIRKFMGLRL